MKVRNLQYNDEAGEFSGFITLEGRKVPVKGTFFKIDFQGGIYDPGDRVVNTVVLRPWGGAPETTVSWSESRVYGCHRWHGAYTDIGLAAEIMFNRGGVSPFLQRSR